MNPLSIIGLGVSAVGGIVNFFANMSAADQAKTLADKNFQQWMALQLPNPADQRAAFQQLSSAGTMNPRLETQINQKNSEMSQISSNPQQDAAQQNALNSLQQTGYQGGMNLQDRATLADAQQQNAVRARGTNDALMQNLAQRGAGNSGFGVAAQLSNQQNQANQDAYAGLNQAAAAQSRALQAIQGAGTLAGNMSTQQFNQDAQKATAQDAINRFNTNNLQSIQQRNVDSQNAAQAANLSNAQNIANANVGIYNSGIKNNQDLNQQNFQNQATQLQNANQSGKESAQAGQQQANAIGNFATNTAQTISGALTNKANGDWWSNYYDEQKKKDQSPLDTASTFGPGQATSGVWK